MKNTRTIKVQDKANYLLRSGAFTDKEVAYQAKLPLFMAKLRPVSS